MTNWWDQSDHILYRNSFLSLQSKPPACFLPNILVNNRSIFGNCTPCSIKQARHTQSTAHAVYIHNLPNSKFSALISTIDNHCNLLTLYCHERNSTRVFPWGFPNVAVKRNSTEVMERNRAREGLVSCPDPNLAEGGLGTRLGRGCHALHPDSQNVLTITCIQLQAASDGHTESK